MTQRQLRLRGWKDGDRGGLAEYFLLWLVSEGAGGATGSRFAANLCDAALRLEHAAEKSRKTAGWVAESS
jgi:hypothetical protein